MLDMYACMYICICIEGRGGGGGCVSCPMSDVLCSVCSVCSMFCVVASRVRCSSSSRVGERGWDRD